MVVTLYSKRGCHLCEDVRALLDDLATERGFTVDEIDIESDVALWSRYRHTIPVVLVDGRPIASGAVDERALTAALAGEG